MTHKKKDSYKYVICDAGMTKGQLSVQRGLRTGGGERAESYGFTLERSPPLGLIR